MRLKKQGFTLIELLVVVLIIGILTAVGVPQYLKAVEKARAAEAMQLMGVLKDSMAICFSVYQTQYETKCTFTNLEANISGATAEEILTDSFRITRLPGDADSYYGFKFERNNSAKDYSIIGKKRRSDGSFIRNCVPNTEKAKHFAAWWPGAITPRKTDFNWRLLF